MPPPRRDDELCVIRNEPRTGPIAKPPYIKPPIAEKILAREPGEVVSET